MCPLNICLASKKSLILHHFYYRIDYISDACNINIFTSRKTKEVKHRVSRYSNQLREHFNVDKESPSASIALTMILIADYNIVSIFTVF